jgi:hypothetical protein
VGIHHEPAGLADADPSAHGSRRRTILFPNISSALTTTSFIEKKTTGQAMMGVDLQSASKEFKTAFKSADIILAKGQANFECLAPLPSRKYAGLRQRRGKDGILEDRI